MKVRVRWFMRPSELPPHLKKDLPSHRNSKELFIAQGDVTGVENVNFVGAIIGKANVLCTTLSPRNLQPSQQLLVEAEHFFSKVFLVQMERLQKTKEFKKVDEALAMKFFNKPEWIIPLIVEKESC